MEIGDKLMKAREALGLSLEEVEEETKIRRKYLKALEEERFQVLPGPVYAKAFLKNYARFLQLDVEELLAEFSRRFKTEPVQETPGEDPGERTSRIVPEKKGRRLYLALAVLVVGLAVSAYYAAVGTGFGRPADQAGQEVRKDTAQSTPRGENVQVPPGQQQAGENVSPPKDPGVNVTLNIKERRSWIQVVVDGNPAYQGILNEGQSRNFEGSDKIYVRLGDAGAVEVLVNGENLGRLGGQGIVVEREFQALPQS